ERQTDAERCATDGLRAETRKAGDRHEGGQPERAEETGMDVSLRAAKRRARRRHEKPIDDDDRQGTDAGEKNLHEQRLDGAERVEEADPRRGRRRVNPEEIRWPLEERPKTIRSAEHRNRQADHRAEAEGDDGHIELAQSLEEFAEIDIAHRRERRWPRPAPQPPHVCLAWSFPRTWPMLIRTRGDGRVERPRGETCWRPIGQWS